MRPVVALQRDGYWHRLELDNNSAIHLGGPKPLNVFTNVNLAIVAALSKSILLLKIAIYCLISLFCPVLLSGA